MSKKRTSHKTRPRGVASGIPVFCLHDEIVDAATLKLWSEQPGQKNPQVAAQAREIRRDRQTDLPGFEP